MKNDMIGKIANVLLLIGGLNWGLYAFGYDLVEMIFTDLIGYAFLSQIVYILVGVSALYVAYEKYA